MSEYNKCCVPNPISTVYIGSPEPGKITVDWVFAPNPNCIYTGIEIWYYSLERSEGDRITLPLGDGPHQIEVQGGKYRVRIKAMSGCGSCRSISKVVEVEYPA